MIIKSTEPTENEIVDFLVEKIMHQEFIYSNPYVLCINNFPCDDCILQFHLDCTKPRKDKAIRTKIKETYPELFL